jgi:hypothetical protein
MSCLGGDEDGFDWLSSERDIEVTIMNPFIGDKSNK